jgi:hypothetical protein
LPVILLFKFLQPFLERLVAQAKRSPVQVRLEFCFQACRQFRRLGPILQRNSSVGDDPAAVPLLVGCPRIGIWQELPNDGVTSIQRAILAGGLQQCAASGGQLLAYPPLLAQTPKDQALSCLQLFRPANLVGNSPDGGVFPRRYRRSGTVDADRPGQQDDDTEGHKQSERRSHNGTS